MGGLRLDQDGNGFDGKYGNERDRTVVERTSERCEASVSRAEEEANKIDRIWLNPCLGCL